MELLINYSYILQITVSQGITKDGYSLYNYDIIYIYRIANKYHISIDLRYYSRIISLYVINLKIKYRANYIRHRNPIEYNEEENSFPYICATFQLFHLYSKRTSLLLHLTLFQVYSLSLLCVFFIYHCLLLSSNLLLQTYHSPLRKYVWRKNKLFSVLSNKKKRLWFSSYIISLHTNVQWKNKRDRFCKWLTCEY